MRALIVLGGDKPGSALLQKAAHSSDLVIAADSGLQAFVGTTLMPDLLIGDMDSVAPDVLAQYAMHVPQRRLNRIKDDTDGVDALDWAIGQGANEIVLLGALGGRLDHALANLMLLVRAHRRGVSARMESEHMTIERVDGEKRLYGAKGDTVSLLPLGSAGGVTLRGFFYPLESATLTSDYPLGMSNVVTQEEAIVRVAEGDLMLFHHLQENIESC